MNIDNNVVGGRGGKTWVEAGKGRKMGDICNSVKNKINFYYCIFTHPLIHEDMFVPNPRHRVLSAIIHNWYVVHFTNISYQII